MKKGLIIGIVLIVVLLSISGLYFQFFLSGKSNTEVNAENGVLTYISSGIGYHTEYALLGDSAWCDKISSSQLGEKDDCYIAVASSPWNSYANASGKITKENPSDICKKISNNTDADECYLRISHEDVNTCENIGNQDKKLLCYQQVAEYINNASICSKIPPDTKINLPEGWVSVYNCLQPIAINKKDPSICAMIPNTKEMTDLEEVGVRDNCYYNLATSLSNDAKYTSALAVCDKIEKQDGVISKQECKDHI
jgi:hypothetical protein